MTGKSSGVAFIYRIKTVPWPAAELRFSIFVKRVTYLLFRCHNKWSILGD